MPIWAWILVGLAPSLPFLISALFIVRFLHTRQLRRLARASGGGSPSVSIVVTAKDEANSIEACLVGALSSSDADLELIVVNDRSEDGTGAIIDSVAARDARVTPIHVTELPAGWLGKNHSLSVGAARATGAYVLFMDGDVVLSERALDLAAAHMHSNDLDHLTLIPSTITDGILERSFLAFFAYCGLGALRAWEVRGSGRAFAGFGAFNMVKRSSYEARGGHEPLRMEVVDDILLGGLMKTEGGRSDVLSAPEDVSVRWHPGARALIGGMEKNGFAASHYSLPVALTLSVIPMVCALGPWLAALLLQDVRAAGFLAGAVLFHIAFGCVGRAAGLGFSVAPLLLVTTPLLSFALARSTWVTLRQGGVRWRGTFYGLEELRSAHEVAWRLVRKRNPRGT